MILQLWNMLLLVLVHVEYHCDDLLCNDVTVIKFMNCDLRNNNNWRVETYIYKKEEKIQMHINIFCYCLRVIRCVGGSELVFVVKSSVTHWCGEMLVCVIIRQMAFDLWCPFCCNLDNLWLVSHFGEGLFDLLCLFCCNVDSIWLVWLFLVLFL